MSQLSKAITLGLFIGILGIIVSLLPFGLTLEENFGLNILFKLRGLRQAPKDVIVVTIDKLSADKLNLPNNPDKWPRSLHAQLTENLANEGASVIAFDLFFNESRSSENDSLFAEAMKKAGNVVLNEYLSKETPLDESGKVIEDVHIVKQVPPIPVLAKSAFTIAGFPLPKVPNKISQYWTFKKAAGDLPTMPTVAFQIFALDVYDEFLHLLQKHSPVQLDIVPLNKEAIITNKNINYVVQVLRNIFKKDPLIAKKMLEDLQNSKAVFIDSRNSQLIKSLVMMYQGPDSQYLNFYGPLRTITSIPYYQVLQPQEMSADNKQINFNGKAVLVGLSENSQPEYKDGFYTVFSKSDGLDISGVEIAATAFANLLENIAIRPISFPFHLATIFLFGLVLGFICRLLPAIASLLSVIGLGALYLIVTLYQFKTGNTWHPIIVPLFIQIPIAYSCAIVCQRITSNKTIKQFLPCEIFHKITAGEKLEKLKSISEKLNGTCLITDIEDFTKISETMDSDEINSFKKRYFESVFEPLKHHDLLIEKTTGDGFMTAWKDKPGAVSGKHACLAAIDISNKAIQFNQSLNVSSQSSITRIGLHYGSMSVGIVGTDGHYELDLSGDTINTTKRIEDLNKNLGTHILLSEDVLNRNDGFLTRKLGNFILAGKSKPLVIHELICLMKKAPQHRIDLCISFSEALNAFKRQSWEDASRKFNDIIIKFEQDGPSQFYLNLCELSKKEPPDKSWDGEIELVKTVKNFRLISDYQSTLMH
jgi:adenylate cyclase